jgi:catechol 2,3-dioxygenase-like lactoylglutathione lyase family enzyme
VGHVPRHHHVNLGVPPGGIPAQVEFLEDVMGYRRVALTDDQRAMGVLWFEGADGCQIHLSEDPEHRAPSRAHVAVTCDDVELGEVLGRIDAAGITTRNLDGAGIRAFVVLKDPSGNRWEVRSID